jgi:hypothetical protein
MDKLSQRAAIVAVALAALNVACPMVDSEAEQGLLMPVYIHHTVVAMGYVVTTSMATHRRVACGRACGRL